jgi:hypothetical protein
MAAWARIQGGIVAELFTPPPETSIGDCFVAEIATQFVAVPNGLPVEQGWTYDGTTFTYRRRMKRRWRGSPIRRGFQIRPRSCSTSSGCCSRSKPSTPTRNR